MKLGWANANQIWFNPKNKRIKKFLLGKPFHVVLSLREFLHLNWKLYQIRIRTFFASSWCASWPGCCTRPKPTLLLSHQRLTALVPQHFLTSSWWTHTHTFFFFSFFNSWVASSWLLWLQIVDTGFIVKFLFLSVIFSHELISHSGVKSASKCEPYTGHYYSTAIPFLSLIT